MTSSTTLISGRYLLGEVLGVGGMGTVYRGTDTLTQDTVAIKRLRVDSNASDVNIVERFKREAEMLSQLNHPNIVKVLDTCIEDDDQYIIMEYIPGGTLAALIRREKHLPLDRILDIGLGLADALTRAHHLKIIHRDIKPANVLMDADGVPRLTDFGVAFLGSQERVTATGMAIGTLDYLSPEALNGESADTRTDIWAFGVMLYEMIVGDRPFRGSTPTQTMVAILRDPSPQVMNLRSDVSPALNTLLRNMMAKDREDRIASVRLVGAELEALRDGTATPSEFRARTSSSTTIPIDEITKVVPVTGMLPELPPSAEVALAHDILPIATSSKRARLSTPVLLLLAAVILLPVLVGGVFMLQNRDAAAVASATLTPSVRIIEGAADVPDAWQTYTTSEITISLPSTWINIANPSPIAVMGQQVLTSFDSLNEEAPQFLPFARTLLTPEMITFTATDPISLTFFMVSVEKVGIGMTPGLQRTRLEGMLRGNSLGLALQPIRVSGLDGFLLPVDVDLKNVGTMRGVVYILLDGENLYWVIFGSTADINRFNENIPIYEQIAGTLRTKPQ